MNTIDLKYGKLDFWQDDKFNKTVYLLYDLDDEFTTWLFKNFYYDNKNRKVFSKISEKLGFEGEYRIFYDAYCDTHRFDCLDEMPFEISEDKKLNIPAEGPFQETDDEIRLEVAMIETAYLYDEFLSIEENKNHKHKTIWPQKYSLSERSGTIDLGWSKIYFIFYPLTELETFERAAAIKLWEVDQDFIKWLDTEKKDREIKISNISRQIYPNLEKTFKIFVFKENEFTTFNYFDYDSDSCIEILYGKELPIYRTAGYEIGYSDWLEIAVIEMAYLYEEYKNNLK